MASVGSSEFLSSRDAAAFLGLSIKTLYGLTSRRQIPYYKPSGKLIFFRKCELEDWIANARIASVNEV